MNAIAMLRSATIAAIVVSTASFLLAAEGANKNKPVWPFFAFDNGTGRGVVPPPAQAKLLKSLGYDGIGYTGVKGVPEMLAALDAEGLKMFSLYAPIYVDPAKPPYEPELLKAIEQLKDRETIIWIGVLGGKPSADDLDDRAVSLLREIADKAAENNLRVALYPHVNFYAQSVDDCLRLVKKAERKNLGMAFNLCHFLKLDDEKNIEATLRKAAPHLFLVSVNGADSGDTRRMGWDRLIQRLDRGSLDLAPLLRQLKCLGYTGPVCLQCYAVPGDIRDNLSGSIAGWRKLVARAAEE
jgi:sugar phosphate isomerase/epimerase